MKKLQTFDASGVGQRVGADQVVVFTFKDEMVGIISWGKTVHLRDQAKQWADYRFTDFMAGALRHPTEERVRKRCRHTKDMFA